MEFGILRRGSTIENEFRILLINASARREPVSGRLQSPWTLAIEISGCRSLVGQGGLRDQIRIVETKRCVGNDTICLVGLVFSDGAIVIDRVRCQ